MPYFEHIGSVASVTRRMPNSDPARMAKVPADAFR
jgi:hypothetical protein